MREPSWPQARDLASAAGTRRPAQRVALAEALGRTLAEPARALADLPGFDTAAMDGWAVAGPGPWRLVGQVLAGQGAPALHPGTAAGIATGALVPPGADAVVRSESGVVAGDTLTADAASGEHIRPRGEELRAGDELAAAGTVVTPAVLGLCAAAGLDDVVVTAVPRVRLLLLGDELLDRGLPAPGQVRDSLGPQLPGWVARLGGQVVALTRVADTVADLTDAVARASADADVVVTTGGTAAGPVDHLHTAVASLAGTLLVDRVAVRPGHPMLLARVAGTPVLGLPGNPQSAIVALLSLGQPLLAAMLGRAAVPERRVTITEAASAPDREHRLLLARESSPGRVAPVAHLGSAMLRGLALADGFAVLPPGGAAAEAEVGWLPLP